MVMQPGPAAPAPGEVQDQPRDLDPPAPRAAEEQYSPAPVNITIDDVPHEFAPAKLWLREANGRVRARLFSDDPPEAVGRDWAGDRFFFEMDLEFPADMPMSGTVSAQDLAAAEWVFRADTSEGTDTPNGIFLGSQKQYQPVEVAVMFQPLTDELVVVTMMGDFAEFDRTAGRVVGKPPIRSVKVIAVINAQTIRR